MKAEEAVANKDRKLMQKVLKTMIREEISSALTQENKVKIE